MWAETLRFWIFFVAALAAILFIGWEQPLRYRLMSEREIASEEGRLKPAPTPSWVEKSFRGSRLDEPARRVETSSDQFGGAHRGTSRY